MKDDFMNKLIVFLLLMMASSFSQSFPLQFGVQMELPQDSELLGSSVRVTPWAGWIDPIGAYGKILVGYYEKKTLSSEAEEFQSLRRLGLEAGYIMPLPSQPYFFAQGQHLQMLNDDRRGDRDWWEYGVGMGAKKAQTPGFHWYGAMEYRFFENHPKLDDASGQWIEGHGVLVYLGFEWALF